MLAVHLVPMRQFMTVPPFGPKPFVALDAIATKPGERARILVVEDNYFVGLTIENALTEAGYEVLAVVESGEAALESIGANRPDLVLMDIRLAGDLDGIDTAIAMRHQGIVSVFASAHFDDAIKVRGAEARPAGWLVKPFSDAEVVEAVQRALKRGKPDA